eukprot:3927625-Pyramimonas_sp.AAC.1
MGTKTDRMCTTLGRGAPGVPGAPRAPGAPGTPVVQACRARLVRQMCHAPCVPHSATPQRTYTICASPPQGRRAHREIL